MTSRVLVVDDHPQVLHLMLRALLGMGHEPVGATTVAEAFQASGPWDLLLVDLGLPNGDGIEVAKHWPEVPVIFVSGRVNADLRKPFTSRQLCDAVAQRLSRRTS